jgi:hypothetical protein
MTPEQQAAIVERSAERTHEAWLAEKLRLNPELTSWPDARGIEQLRPWAELDEQIREFDRVVVRSVLEVVVEELGL